MTVTDNANKVYSNPLFCTIIEFTTLDAVRIDRQVFSSDHTTQS